MICEISKCVGCGNCVQVCPVNAVTLRKDRYGFLVASVEEATCLKCGKCDKVCPGLDVKTDFVSVPCYAAQALDYNLVKNSSSGGLFSVFAEWILASGGVVCGAIQDEKTCYVHHIITDASDGLVQMRGSKYVQSNLENTIAETLNYLKQDRAVLYSGTPCQISALNKRVLLAKVNKSKLYTIDVVCHGTPNYQFLRDFISYHEHKTKKHIKRLVFRNKEIGWNFDNIGAQYYNEDNIQLLNENYFHSYFGWGYIYRESCYSCSKAGSSRVADITLGDFWGIQNYLTEKQFPNMNQGTSMVMINTTQGSELFESVKNRINFYSLDVDIACKGNHQLVSPTSINQPRRKIIMEFYKLFGSKGVATLYHVEKLLISLYRKIKK